MLSAVKWGLQGLVKVKWEDTHGAPSTENTKHREAQKVAAVLWPNFSPRFEFFAGSLGFRRKMKGMSTKQDRTKSFPGMPQHAALPACRARQSWG